jgi:hypothetical protein
MGLPGGLFFLPVESLRVMASPLFVLRRICGINALLDLCTMFAFHDGDVVLALQVEPELR